MQLTLCLVLAMAAATPAAETKVGGGLGLCKSGIEIDPAFSLAAYAKEGTWDYAKGTLTASTDKFDSMTQKIEVTSSGEYKRTSFFKKKDGTDGIFATDLTSDSTDGPLVSKSKNKVAKIYFIKYGDGIAYYYICNDNGVDTGVDMRLVLSHGKLTDAQEKIVQEIEDKYKFGGQLKDFNISQ